MDENELRDLKERTALVKEMTEHPGWQMLVDRAMVTLQQKQVYLIRGNAKTFEEYVSQAAWMDGLSFIVQLPDRLEQELFEVLSEIKQLEDIQLGAEET